MKIVDGDTIRVMLDLGCDTRLNMTLRLAGINAPEMSTDEGVTSKNFLLTLLNEGPKDEFDRPVIFVQTIKDRKEKYGRYLAYLFPFPDSELSFNEVMVEQGYAAGY